MRKFIAIAIALAIVFPPVSGLANKALGGDGTHLHFDHIWHQADQHDTHVRQQNFGADQQDHHPIKALDDHVHMTVMVIIATYSMSADVPVRSYHDAVIAFHQGRSLAPPDHPPRALS